MKSILVLLALALSPLCASAAANDYYNPDYKCSIRDGVTVYVNVSPNLKVSVTSYNSRSNKVFTDYLSVGYLGQTCDGIYYYGLENKLNDPSISYLQISSAGINVLDVKGALVSECLRIGRSVDEHGPYYP